MNVDLIVETKAEMLERPARWRPCNMPKSSYTERLHYNHYKGKPIIFFTCLFVASLVPYASIRTYNRIDRLGYWQNRIEQKRVRKMAFDYMLKTQAEKERDLIEEYADF